MHCKFLVILLIVFLFFSFFSSACEFRLVERIGAQGKQNPDFIYYYLCEASLTVLIVLFCNGYGMYSSFLPIVIICAMPSFCSFIGACVRTGSWDTTL